MYKCKRTSSGLTEKSELCLCIGAVAIPTSLPERSEMFACIRAFATSASLAEMYKSCCIYVSEVGEVRPNREMCKGWFQHFTRSWSWRRLAWSWPFAAIRRGLFSEPAGPFPFSLLAPGGFPFSLEKLKGGVVKSSKFQ